MKLWEADSMTQMENADIGGEIAARKIKTRRQRESDTVKGVRWDCTGSLFVVGDTVWLTPEYNSCLTLE